MFCIIYDKNSKMPFLKRSKFKKTILQPKRLKYALFTFSSYIIKTFKSKLTDKQHLNRSNTSVCISMHLLQMVKSKKKYFEF